MAVKCVGKDVIFEMNIKYIIDENCKTGILKVLLYVTEGKEIL